MNWFLPSSFLKWIRIQLSVHTKFPKKRPRHLHTLAEDSVSHFRVILSVRLFSHTAEWLNEPKEQWQRKNYLVGKKWTREIAEQAGEYVYSEFTPLSDTRSGAEFRRLAARNLMLKFGKTQTLSLSGKTSNENILTIAPANMSAGNPFIDDILVNTQLLYGHIMYSPHAYAKIKSIDISTASSVPVCMQSFWQKIFRWKPTRTCSSRWTLSGRQRSDLCGQAIVLIAAENAECARAAEKLIRIEFEPLDAILDLETAIQKNTLLAPPRTMQRGDADAALKNPNIFSAEKSAPEPRTLVSGNTVMSCYSRWRSWNEYLFIYTTSFRNTGNRCWSFGASQNEIVVETRRMGGAFEERKHK